MADQQTVTSPAAGSTGAPTPAGWGGDWPTPRALQPAALALGAALAAMLVGVLAGMPLPFDLSQGQGVVILLRLGVPLLILRWPLVGGILIPLIASFFKKPASA